MSQMGRQGFAPAMPYGRITATGGNPSIPAAWVEQAAVGGIIVGSLSGSLSSSLYRLAKQPDGSARGSLLSTPVLFTPLRGSQEGQPPVPPPVAHLESAPVMENAHTPLDFPKALRNASFALFAEYHLPGITLLRRFLESPGHSCQGCIKMYRDIG